MLKKYTLNPHVKHRKNIGGAGVDAGAPSLNPSRSGSIVVRSQQFDLGLDSLPHFDMPNMDTTI